MKVQMHKESFQPARVVSILSDGKCQLWRSALSCLTRIDDPKFISVMIMLRETHATQKAPRTLYRPCGYEGLRHTEERGCNAKNRKCYIFRE